VFTLQLAGDIDVSQIQSMKNDLEGSIASKLGIDRTLVKLSILDARRHLLALTLAIQVLAPSKDEAEAFANQSAQVQEATQEVAREANIDLDVTVTSELFEPIAEPSPPSPPSPPATPSSPPAASPSSPPSSTTSATKDSDDGAEVSAGGFQKDTRDEPQGSGPPVAVIAGVAGGVGALALLSTLVMFLRRSGAGKEALDSVGGGATRVLSASLPNSPLNFSADAGCLETCTLNVAPLDADTYGPPLLPGREVETAGAKLAAQEQAAMMQVKAAEQRMAAEATAAPSMSAMQAGGQDHGALGVSRARRQLVFQEEVDDWAINDLLECCRTDSHQDARGSKIENGASGLDAFRAAIEDGHAFRDAIGDTYRDTSEDGADELSKDVAYVRRPSDQALESSPGETEATQSVAAAAVVVGPLETLGSDRPEAIESFRPSTSTLSSGLWQNMSLLEELWEPMVSRSEDVPSTAEVESPAAAKVLPAEISPRAAATRSNSRNDTYRYVASRAAVASKAAAPVLPANVTANISLRAADTSSSARSSTSDDEAFLPRTCTQIMAPLPVSLQIASPDSDLAEMREALAGRLHVLTGREAAAARLDEGRKGGGVRDDVDDWASMLKCCRTEGFQNATRMEMDEDSSELHAFRHAVTAGLESKLHSGEEAKCLPQEKQQLAISGELVMMTPRRLGDESGLAVNQSSVLLDDRFEAGIAQPGRPAPSTSQQPEAILGELVLMTPRRRGVGSSTVINQSSVFVADYFEAGGAQWERMAPFVSEQSEETSGIRQDETLVAI